MKKLILVLGIILLSCMSTQRAYEDNIKVRITNDFIKDSSDVELEVINYTSKNFYLQFDESKLYESILFFSSEYLHNVDLKLEDEDSKQIEYEIVDYQCYSPFNEKFYKQSKSVKNVFKIKSGEIKKIKMPFLMKKTVNDYCWYGFKKDQLKFGHKYFVTFEYKMYSESDRQILSNATKDSLNDLGYEFYDRNIISNRVPLHIKFK